MPLWGVPEWGASPAVNPPLPGCDAANSLADLWYRLGFLNADDANVDDRWVTVNELYQFADEAVKRLAYTVGAFKTYDASVAIDAGTAAYALPPHHVFTVLAWLVYASYPYPVQFLRLTSAAQLYAIDAAWPLTTGNPLRLSLDANGTGTATLWPAPVTNATLSQIQQESPHWVRAGASDIPLSPICQDYFSYAVLAAALAKESDHARPEVAQHCIERMKLMKSVFETYWGPRE